jgi:hypothetical protein
MLYRLDYVNGGRPVENGPRDGVVLTHHMATATAAPSRLQRN